MNDCIIMKAKQKNIAKKPYQLLIDPELYRLAKEKAESEEMMLSQVIRRFLQDYVRNPQGKLFH